jgi:hypothetical protein
MITYANLPQLPHHTSPPPSPLPTLFSYYFLLFRVVLTTVLFYKICSIHSKHQNMTTSVSLQYRYLPVTSTTAPVGRSEAVLNMLSASACSSIIQSLHKPCKKWRITRRLGNSDIKTSYEQHHPTTTHCKATLFNRATRQLSKRHTYDWDETNIMMSSHTTTDNNWRSDLLARRRGRSSVCTLYSLFRAPFINIL